MRTRWGRFLALAGVFAAVSGGLARQPDGMTLAVCWRRSVSRGVEWCAAAPRAAGLLVFDKAGRLDLLDVRDGSRRIDHPVSLERGSRLAGAGGAVVYAFGATTVYGLRAVCRRDGSRPARMQVAWREVGATAPAGADPETVARIVAARATGEGVLVVRSDGHIAELVRDDGSPRWSAKVAPFDVCTLDVCGRWASLVTYGAGKLHVVSFDLRAERPMAVEYGVSGPAPLWSGLSNAGVVVVWSDRWTVCVPGGRTRAFRFPPDVRATAAAVGLAPVCGGGEKTSVATRLLVGGERGLWAFDLSTGTPAMPQQAGKCASAGGFRLLIRPGLAAVTSDRRWELWRLPALRLVACGDGSLIGAAVCPCEARGGALRGYIVQTGGGSVGLRLARVGLEEGAPAGGHARVVGLAEASGVPRQLIWIGKTLVVVEDRRILAYTLP